MTRVRLDQLPASVRAKVEATDSAKRRTAAVSPANNPALRGISPPTGRKPRATDSAPCPGRCTCGRTYPSYLAWEKHCDSDGEGHTRWSVDL